MAEYGNSLVTAKESKITEYLSRDDVKKWLNKTLSSPAVVAKFTADVISCVNANPTIAACLSSSIVSGALVANSLKLSLSPTLGHCYLVPYEDKKSGAKKAQFQMGYKGYIQLALRSGCYENINVISIKEGELISWNPLTEEIKVKIIEDDFERERAKTIGYYAYFKHINGFKKQLYWSKEKMLIHADRYSPAFNLEAKKGREPRYDRVSYADYEAGKVSPSDMWKYSSFWYADFDGMAYKTMLRQLISKWGVVSVDIEMAFRKEDEYNEELFSTDSGAVPAEPVPEKLADGNQGDNGYSEDDFFASEEEAERAVAEAERKAAEQEKAEQEQPKKPARKTAKKSAATLFDDDGEGEISFK